MFEFFKKDKNVEPVVEDILVPEAETVKDTTAPDDQPLLSIENDQEESSKIQSPEIPEHVFVEYSRPNPQKNMEPQEVNVDVNDLRVLYRHLEQNLEKKGYEDALMNPDSSFMHEYVKYINNELNIVISKVKTYYSGHMREIDFHIATRTRNGMVETVDELVSRRQTIEEEIAIVNSIEVDSVNRNGLCENLFLGYQRGFKNGFAAITYNNILGKKSY